MVMTASSTATSKWTSRGWSLPLKDLGPGSSTDLLQTKPVPLMPAQRARNFRMSPRSLFWNVMENEPTKPFVGGSDRSSHTLELTLY